MQCWGSYFLWCIVVGMLAGIDISTHYIAALIGEFFAASCAWYYQMKAARGVVE